MPGLAVKLFRHDWPCFIKVTGSADKSVSSSFEIATCWSSVCKNFKHGDRPSFGGLILTCLFWALSNVPHMDIFSQRRSLEPFSALSRSSYSLLFWLEAQYSHRLDCIAAEIPFDYICIFQEFQFMPWKQFLFHHISIINKWLSLSLTIHAYMAWWSGAAHHVLLPWSLLSIPWNR